MDKNIAQGLSVWIEGSLFSSVFFFFFFFFFLNQSPGRFPRKILGSKRQMNTEAEYDYVGNQGCMLCQGVRLRGVEIQRFIRAYLGHPGTRYSDVWCLPEPFC